MLTRRLGSSDLDVSAIALGAWFLDAHSHDVAAACTRAAFDAGITFFDTANTYGKGAAEEAWGEILRDYDRSSYVLATKVYFPMGPDDQGLSAAQIRKQLDASLRRLRTDYVDLYQCHRFDTEVPIEETMGVLTEAVQAGKVRWLGFSEWTPEQIRAGMAVADAERFVSSQPQYSLLWREPEAEVFPVCAELGIGQIVFSPLAQGILSGKYKPGQPLPAGSRGADDARNEYMLARSYLRDDLFAAVQRLVPIAEGAGLTLPQLALAWVLRRDEVTAAIIGASRPEQVVQNVRAAEVRLSTDVLAAVEAALADQLPTEGATHG